MNFLRGTGLKGLTGIPPINDYIRRPLLSVDRQAIEAYAHAQELRFVEDSSNRSTDYTRNLIRLDLLPKLRTLYPQIERNLLNNIERFKSVQTIYQEAIHRWLRKYVSIKGDEQQVSVALLLQPRNRAVLHEWLSPYGFSEKQEAELIRLGQSTSGHFISSADGKFRVIRHRKHFILAPAKTDWADDICIDAGTSEISFSAGKLKWERLDLLPKRLMETPSVVLLDAAELHFPLVLRKWRAGDYFYPLGLNKKKKIARFLIDQKLSAIEKENTWVLECGQRIVWVLGQRIDHRFRIKDNTRSVIRFEFIR
jgi:tRNA(Ile)-lysidine synthase